MDQEISEEWQIWPFSKEPLEYQAAHAMMENHKIEGDQAFQVAKAQHQADLADCHFADRLSKIHKFTKHTTIFIQ